MIILAFVLSLVLSVNAQPQEQSFTGKVTRVVDGDTIVVMVNGKAEKVRYIGVDTPETKDPRTVVQCFGVEASKTNSSLVLGKEVRVVLDPTQPPEKYGRHLGYIYVGDVLINDKLIREGFAHEYTYRIPYQKQAQFKDAQREARENKRGLWADETCGGVTKTPKIKRGQMGAAKNKAKKSSDPCARNLYDCSDFKLQTEAQAIFEQCGGVKNDVHKLDRNKDGRVCEDLP